MTTDIERANEARGTPGLGRAALGDKPHHRPVSETNTTTAAAGWYPDGSGQQRYWDGVQWTDHTAPLAPSDESQATFAPAATSTSKPHVVGIIALVVAALGFVFACVPGALIIGWILLPIAFVLAIVGLFLKGRKWPAIAALIVSIVGTVVGLTVFFAVVATSFEEAFDRNEVTGSTQASDEDEDDAEPEPVEQPDPTPAPAPEAAGNLAFGDTMTWEDGVTLTVGAPQPFTPSQYAAGADFATNLLFSITITNGSAENLDPSAYSRVSSGGQEASRIIDLDNPAGDVVTGPMTVLLPGQSVTWLEAWSVADPNSLTFQIAPGVWDYEDAIFTNLQ